MIGDGGCCLFVGTVEMVSLMLGEWEDFYISSGLFYACWWESVVTLLWITCLAIQLYHHAN